MVLKCINCATVFQVDEPGVDDPDSYECRWCFTVGSNEKIGESVKPRKSKWSWSSYWAEKRMKGE